MDMQKEISWLLKEKYSGRATRSFYQDIKRLKRGEPLDYVIGFTEFLGCKIDLSKKTFIPRPETEFWVEKAISELKNNKKSLKILDIFAGSGCIGVALLFNVYCATVHFAEKDKKALEQTKINCKLNKLDKKRCEVIESDVFSNIKGKYNFIFANPPYAPITTRNEVEKPVLKFEPHMALFGGKNGLFYAKKLLSGAKKHIVSGGKIFMEFNSRQKDEIRELIEKYNYKSYKFHKDQYGKWRWVMIE